MIASLTCVAKLTYAAKLACFEQASNFCDSQRASSLWRSKCKNHAILEMLLSHCLGDKIPNTDDYACP